MIIDVIWYAIFSHNRLAGFILGVVHGLHFSEVITPKNPFQIGQDLLNQPTIGPIGWNVPFFWSNVGTALTITQIWKFRKLEEISATGVRNLALSFKVGSFFCHTIDHVFFYITVRAGSLLYINSIMPNHSQLNCTHGIQNWWSGRSDHSKKIHVATKSPGFL